MLTDTHAGTMSADLITYLLSFPPSGPVSNREYCILVARYKDQLKRGTSRESFLKNAGTQQDVLEVMPTFRGALAFLPSHDMHSL